jgi:hypothetical protein
MFKKLKKKRPRINLVKTLEIKLQELIQSREALEARESAAKELEEKKVLVQQTIDITHQIQALRIVIDLFVGGNEK